MPSSRAASRTRRWDLQASTTSASGMSVARATLASIPTPIAPPTPIAQRAEPIVLGRSQTSSSHVHTAASRFASGSALIAAATAVNIGIAVITSGTSAASSGDNTSRPTSHAAANVSAPNATSSRRKANTCCGTSRPGKARSSGAART